MRYRTKWLGFGWFLQLGLDGVIIDCPIATSRLIIFAFVSPEATSNILKDKAPTYLLYYTLAIRWYGNEAEADSGDTVAVSLLPVTNQQLAQVNATSTKYKLVWAQFLPRLYLGLLTTVT
ncbi:hypothetical protein BX600DRAFT_444031 [Xylariales sp. PMI_506]|nr:hypothetical protein BX600DRAFT_444031 [Xylariales sp. PMI_506]